MWNLSIRYLLSKKTRTAIILLGIILGTTAYVIISGMMEGFQSFIVKNLIENEAHVRISSREEYLESTELDPVLFSQIAHVFWAVPPSGRRDKAKIEYPQGWFDRLNDDSTVLAYTPQTIAKVIFRRANVSVPGTLTGTQPLKQIKVTNIESYMKEGNFEDLSRGGNRIVVGFELMKKLGARINESILVSTGKEKVLPFKVVGVFQTGIKPVDEATAYASQTDVQKANQTPNLITDIAIKLSNPETASKKAALWRTLSQDDVKSWDEINSSILSVFKTQDIVRNSMIISILLVAGFGIYNILNMLIYQKRQDIAILRSMGFEKKHILKLFLTQGMILGGLGGILGQILGYLICIYLTTIEVDPGRIGGGKLIVSFDTAIYIKGFMLSFVSCFVASFLPARSATKLTPIDIIRSE